MGFYANSGVFRSPLLIILLCGTNQNVEMHHIKHIRKTAFSKLPQKTYLQMMSLRNRKSIPVRRNCHINVIHHGKYSGEVLNTLLNINPGVLDNRIINIEAYVNPSKIAQRWLLWQISRRKGLET